MGVYKVAIYSDIFIGKYTSITYTSRGVLCENGSYCEISFSDPKFANMINIMDARMKSIINMKSSIISMSSVPNITLSYKSMIDYNTASSYINITKNTGSYSIRNGVLE